jgi:TP901 family phage tail tape measure protein
MASKDIKILIKTLADVTGISRVTAAWRKWAADHKVGAAAVTASLRGLAAAAKASFSAFAAAGRAAFNAVSHGMQTVRNAAIGLGVGIGGAAREFYTWNSEAARAWALMDIGKDEFVKMRTEIAAMSAELGVAKDELGKGWTLAAGSGVENNEIVRFLRTAAKVAITDGSDIETAINGMTSVLNAFGYQSADAARVTDMLFSNVDRGKSSFHALSSYIAQAAPTAAALGVGLDQILAAEVHLSKQGYATSTAYVAIRNAMLALSDELGDGWAKTMTFQEALQKVREEANGSETALAKIFGDRTVGAVLAMTGENAAKAAEELAAMRNSTDSLGNAYSKVDSEIQHWPKLWQSLRLLVSNIGEAIDTSLRPAIDYITEKLGNLTKGDGFAAMARRLGDAISNAAAKLIAGVQTAVDVLSRATLGGVIAGAVGALVDTAITLLAEGLRALGVVVRALAKIFASALAEDMMKIDLPFRNEEKAAREAAIRNLINLTPTQAAAFGIPKEFMERDAIMSPAQLKARQKRMQEWASGLSLDQAAAIATATRDSDINAALAQATDSFGAARGRIEGAGSRIISDLSRRTGTDISAAYQRNLGAAMSIAGPVQGPPAPPQQPAAAPAATAQASASSAEVVAAAHSARDAQRDTSAELISTLKDIKHEQRILREQIKSIRARD